VPKLSDIPDEDLIMELIARGYTVGPENKPVYPTYVTPPTYYPTYPVYWYSGPAPTTVAPDQPHYGNVT